MRVAAFPKATTRGGCIRGTETSPATSVPPSRLTFVSMAWRTSIVAMVSRKICRASCFPLAYEGWARVADRMVMAILSRQASLPRLGGLAPDGPGRLAQRDFKGGFLEGADA